VELLSGTRHTESHPSASSTDDGSIIAGLQALDPWHEDLGFPTATQIGLLNACGSFSGIVAGPLIAFIDERFGRRWGIRCKFPCCWSSYFVWFADTNGGSVYGYMILIGSIVGCIAGVDGVDGYARESTMRSTRQAF
jgi:SP family sugar:H+ symporter-like MFS transporter